MGYFFSKDEASKNGDPPPPPPLPAENHQEPAVAENETPMETDDVLPPAVGPEVRAEVGDRRWGG